MEQRRRTASKFFPVYQPALNLDFRTGFLPPEITFSRASTATFVGSNGLRQQVAANTPRFAYDPLTLARKNLMLECEAFQNVVLHNADLTNGAVWASAGSLTVTGGQADDAGGNSATLLDDTDAGVFATRAQNIAVPNDSNTYILSVVLAAGTAAASTVRVTFSGGVVRAYDAQITWATKAVTPGVNATAADVFVEPASVNGYYKVSVRGANNSSGNTLMQVFVFPAGSSGVANTGSCIVSTVNCGLGSVPQSHVPTAGVAATRAADACLVNGVNLAKVLNPWGGTLVVSGSRTTAGASTGVMLGLSETNVFNNSMYFSNTAGDASKVVMGFVSGGVAQASLNMFPSSILLTSKFATTWAPGHFAASTNGAAAAVDSSGTVPTPMQTMSIGSAPWAPASAGWFGFFDYVRYWPQDCDPKMLQFLTGSQYN